MIRHRLSLEEFQALLEKAPEGLRLELLDGEVYEMAPIGSGHASLVTYLAKQLERLYGDRALVYVQNPLRLSPTPCPNRTSPCSGRGRILPGKAPRSRGHPLGGGGQLLPREMDLKKLALYAQGGVPEVWLVEEGEAWRCTGSPGAPVTATASLWSPGRRWPPSSSPIPLSSGTP